MTGKGVAAKIMDIHPQAVVSPHAELAPGVKIGAYSFIGDNVTIGRDTVVMANAYIEGFTQIGERNRIYPFSILGTPPQDIGYRGEDTKLIIGNENIIREYVSIHRATTKEAWKTVIGDRNYIMAYAHVAHDCILGNDIILSNVATLAGHTSIGDHVILGGLVAVQQFVRIGPYSFVGGKSGLDRDVPPYMIAAGPRARLYGINRKGLTRQGFPPDVIDGLKKAFRIIWRENRNFSKGITQVRKELESFSELEILLDFLNGSKRGILR